MGRSCATDRSEQLNRSGLFLHRQLLLDFAPGADFETAADPAQRLRPNPGGLVPANGALRRLLQAVGRNRSFRLFQNGGGNHRLRLWLWLTSHKTPTLILLWQTSPVQNNSYYPANYGR